MKEKENRNLPAIQKKMNIFDRIISSFNTKRELKKSEEIISKLNEIEEYGVLSMPAFRYAVGKKIQENPNGVLVMSDINNLYEANELAGNKELVNKDIKKVIDSMKESIATTGINEFDIGKLGDEIYVFMENCNQEQVDVMLEGFHSIRSGLLTVSCGHTTDLSNGVEHAMNKAEEFMSADKSRYKYNKLMDFCGGKVEKIIDYCIEKELSKARIDLEELRNKSQKMQFVNLYDKVVSNFSFSNNSLKNLQDSESRSGIDKNVLLEQKYMNEANIKMKNASQNDKEKYVLAQLLSRTPVGRTVNNEYFEKFEKQNLKSKKNINFLGLDVSGLKHVNDTYGHDVGDIEIDKVLSNLSLSLKELDIKPITHIVRKGAGDAFVVIPEIKDEKQKQILSELINNVDSKLDVICSITGKENIKENQNINNGIDLFNNLEKIGKEELKENSFNRKITDEKTVERLISGIYESIFDNDSIKAFVKNDSNLKEYISKYVNVRFSNIIMESKKESKIVDFDDFKRRKKEKENIEGKENNLDNKFKTRY